ncbi:MAG: hypothetical protein ABIL22_04240 [candidate division WOR-3 bacterium]
MEDLKLVITAIDNASKVMNNVGKSISTVSDRAGKLGRILTAGVAGFGFVKLIESGQESESAMMRLQAVMTQTGNNFDALRGQIESVTAALQDKTVYGDEEQKRVLADLILSTGSYQTALQSLPAVLDIAAAAQLDLHTATMAYTKAIEGNIGVLGRSLPFVQRLKEEGKSNAEIMQIVRERTKGAAEAMGNISPMVKLKNAFGDIAQIVGTALIPVVQLVYNLVKILGPQAIIAASGFAVLYKIILAFGLMTKTVGGVIAIIGLLVTAFITLWNKFAGFRAFWMTSWTAIKTSFHAVVSTIMNYIRMIVDNFKAVVGALSRPFSLSSWKEAVSTIGKNIADFGSQTINEFRDVGAKTAEAWSINYRNELEKQSKKTSEAMMPSIDFGKITKEDIEKTKEANKERITSERDLSKEIGRLTIDYFEARGMNREADLAQLDEWYNEQLLKFQGHNEQLVMIQEIYSAKRKEIDNKYSISFQSALSFIRGSLDALTTAVGDSLYALVTQGTSAAETLKSIWKDMASSVIKLISQIIAKLIVMKALMTLVPGGGLLGIPIPRLLGFQTRFGEVLKVPGPINAPVPIIAHGQEIIGRPTGGFGNSIIVNGDIFGWDEAMERIRSGLYSHSRMTGLPVQA